VSVWLPSPGGALVLPANIHAANAGVTLRGAPATPMIPRLALQVLFIVLVWWSAFLGGRQRGVGEGAGKS